jgi:hypothetical protein
MDQQLVIVADDVQFEPYEGEPVIAKLATKEWQWDLHMRLRCIHLYGTGGAQW